MNTRKQLNTLDAVTTLDGRYRDKVEALSEYVSEKALIRTRFQIEIKYFIALSEMGIIRKLGLKEKKTLENLIKNFSDADAARVKEIEETTRHDVKAVEYLLREKLEKTSLKDVREEAHLFLTSEDVNNLAVRINLKNALEFEIVPNLEKLFLEIFDKTKKYKAIPMLARTHGQSAVPTTVGKELAVFASRLEIQLEKLRNAEFTGKLSGAVGNYNSFKVASAGSYKEWVKFSENFVKQFGLTLNPVTTQINTYEDIVEALQILSRVNNILIDFAADMWRYISDGWFVLEKVHGEVGSSTMPQKINPIDFENGEGNLSLANDIISGLSSRLQISRLQRDLRDSTQIRNMGLVLGFTLIGTSSIRRGFSRSALNRQAVSDALNSDWSILSEGAQVWLRVNEDVADPYSLFKNATRGLKMGEKEWKEKIKKMEISNNAKKAFLALRPENYTGFAEEIATEVTSKHPSKRVK